MVAPLATFRLFLPDCTWCCFYVQLSQEGVLFSPEGKFTYFASSGHPGTIQELIAVHDGNRDLFQMIADAAVDWDGKDPVRNLN